MDQTIPQGGWWSRNWKWFVPVGCLSLLATCGCCIGGSVVFAFNKVKDSRSYQAALAKAKEDPDVREALGTPVEAGWLVQFSTTFRNGESRTDLRIPLKGPKGEGALLVKATEHGKEVTFQQLDFIGPGSKVVHLVETHPPPGDKGDVDLDEPGDDEDNEGQEAVGAEHPDVTVEANADRPGSDFRDYESGDSDASECAMDCAGDDKCKAYSFLKPANGKIGRCRLKNKVPPKVPSDCCVAGVKK